MRDAAHPWRPDYTEVSLHLASPATMRAWSHGEVLRMSTFNVDGFTAEAGGLFCERIFGPIRDWTCRCGAYAGIAHQGVTCDICGVRITLSRVRGDRMGHIDLAAPVAHPWFIHGDRPRLATLLGMRAADLRAVVYGERFIVTDPGATSLPAGSLLDAGQMDAARAEHGEGFAATTGGTGVQELLRRLDLDDLIASLRRTLADPATAGRRAAIERRLALALDLQASGNDPQWMVMSVIPVVPPTLRPCIERGGGDRVTADLNELYRLVIYRSNRLRRLGDLKAPAILLRAESRALQKAVDALFDNDLCRPAVIDGGRRLRSLTDMVHGRRGRFRENLRGKMQDYSARAVVVPDPGLTIGQCGLPEAIICELFRPFIVRLLVDRGHAASIKAARHLLDRRDDTVWAVIDDAIAGRVVLLSRVPNLYRMGVLAFTPLRVGGHAIRIHPMVGREFRIHFAGESMAVHLPLSRAAQAEARALALATVNIRSSSSGLPVMTATNTIALGCAWLTMVRSGQPGEGFAFSDLHEVRSALAAGAVSVHTLIRFRMPAGTRIAVAPARNQDAVEVLSRATLVDTTPGRLLFHEVLPAGTTFANRQQDRHSLRQVIVDAGDRADEVLAALARLGCDHATGSGLSFAAADCPAPADLAGIMGKADERVAKFRRALQRGLITPSETHRNLVEVWTYTAEAIAEALATRFTADQPGTGDIDPLALMHQARVATPTKLRHIIAFHGQVASPGGTMIPDPVRSSYRAGLSIADYHTLTRARRVKPLAHARKLAQSRDLTRALVAAGAAVVVGEHDCGTADGVTQPVSATYDQITGRTACAAIADPATAAEIVAANHVITRGQSRRIAAAGITGVRVRSPVTCAARRGICRMCYGDDLRRGCLVDLGAAVGVVAGLALATIAARRPTPVRHTFYICGSCPMPGTGQELHSSLNLAGDPLQRLRELLEARPPQSPAVIAEVSGTVDFGDRHRGLRTLLIHVDARGDSGEVHGNTVAHPIPPGKHYRAYRGDRVQAGDALTDGELDLQNLQRIAGDAAVLAYVRLEIQDHYRPNGVVIDDKHIEVIVRQMLATVRIDDPGDLPHAPGSLIAKARIRADNRDAAASGRRGAAVTPMVMGISEVARHGESFIAAAAHDARQALAGAAIAGACDPLAGITENVILGHVVPCGTGHRQPQRQDPPTP